MYEKQSHQTLPEHPPIVWLMPLIILKLLLVLEPYILDLLSWFSSVPILGP